MNVYAWLIDFAHFRENCPTGIIPEWMRKVTQHNGIKQYMSGDYFCGGTRGQFSYGTQKYAMKNGRREKRMSAKSEV